MKTLTPTEVSAQVAMAVKELVRRAICEDRTAMAAKHNDHLEEVLAKLYVDEVSRSAAVAIGALCDDELDRSGGLLGRVRDRAAKLREQPK